MRVSLAGVCPGDAFPYSGSAGRGSPQRLSRHSAAQNEDNEGTVLPGERGSLGHGGPQVMGIPRGWRTVTPGTAGGCPHRPRRTPQDLLLPLVPTAPCPHRPHGSPRSLGHPGALLACLAVPAWRGSGSVTAPPPLPACSVHFILSKHGTAAAPRSRLPAIRLWPSFPAPSPVSTPPHVPRSPCLKLPGSPHPTGETEAGLQFACGPSGVHGQAPLALINSSLSPVRCPQGHHRSLCTAPAGWRPCALWQTLICGDLGGFGI